MTDPVLPDFETWYLYARQLKLQSRPKEAIAALGVNVIGGCCGTNPEFIARARETLADRLAPAAGAGPGRPR